MRARISRPAKTAMQSGKSKSQVWLLEYEPTRRKTVDPLMGYTSTSDAHSQIRLNFDTKEDAIAYAERNNIEYSVREPKEQRRRAASYSDNFKFDRKVPWTH